jgi:L-fucose isomerase-like protein
VQENDVTACLGLSYLNDLGIPAGCEGDLCSITGMMIAREIFGELPWMANVASIQGNEVLFAHCTAPTAILSEHHINTHFETGKGTAIHGRFNLEDVTAFRLNSSLDKVFSAHGKAVDGMYEKHACRTQLHVEFEPEVITELKKYPLGNHHLLVPGDLSKELSILRSVIELTG